ncbi:MAG: hypothetical protein NTV49_12225 [Kiritimatiellaeota bacterium]|nr:hypothetical protein [Kiritimatiellota bacterium]
MKRKIIIGLLFVLVFALGIYVGKFAQHAKTGYHYQLLKADSFPFLDGEVALSYAFESIGMPFLMTETSMLTVKTKPGLTPITIYKARRIFQESSPYIEDVKTATNQITWRDGISTYALTVTPITNNAEQGAAPLPSAPRTGPSEGAR